MLLLENVKNFSTHDNGRTLKILREELIKINEDLNYQKGFLKSVEAKLSNKNFSNNAPERVINNEQ